jgi:UDP-N-acetylglucosamine enolpyruvyl transferase
MDVYMLLVEGSEYKEQQPYWFCQDSIQMGLYTLAAEVCRRTVNTNHLTPNSYKHVVCSLIYTAKCFKLNSSNCQLNCYSIDYTEMRRRYVGCV